MSVSHVTKLILAMKSDNMCAFPECRCSLVKEGEKSDDCLIGEVAHICGQKRGSARYCEEMSDEQRDHYTNLIYLCPNCHTKVDKQREDYSAEFLFKIKQKHEEWVDSQRDEAMLKVSFTELDMAAKAIASDKFVSRSDNFSVIPIEDKLNKNKLSNKVRLDISSGLIKSGEVERFIRKMATEIDEGFPERLKNGFREKYMEFKKTLDGDNLFYALLNYAQAGQREFEYQLACLAILSYLFHVCEVFEK